jgi:hypothetical protein
MATLPLEPRHLLHYLPEHRVLVCRECQYAIQPSAISRHLKDLHRIYRSKRQEFMNYANGFDLADPKDVSLPKPKGEPVPGLTITSGLVCGVDGCEHLCATTKRMKMHRAAEHVGTKDTETLWHPVELQTFFRGNQLKYFIVQQQSPASSQESHSIETDASSIDVEGDSTGNSTSNECHSSNLDPQLMADIDTELLEHFKSCTCHEIGYDPMSRDVWHKDVPALAAKHPFLMHGMLACAALHTAFGNPKDRRRYKMIAAHHQGLALPTFRTEIARPSEDNCFALLAFTQLLILHCFAADTNNEDLFIVGGKDDIDLPEWLYVIRGSCHIFTAVWPHIMNGPYLSLMTGGVAVDDLECRDVPVEMPEVDKRLRRLLDILHFNIEKRRSDGTFLETTPLLAAILILIRAFSKAQAAQLRNNYTMWIAIYTWPTQVPEEYLNLLKKRDPAALVVLAHYCILLRPLEHNWFMQGYSSRLLSRIYSQLDEEWHEWMQWPLEEIGLPSNMQ